MKYLKYSEIQFVVIAILVFLQCFNVAMGFITFEAPLRDSFKSEMYIRRNESAVRALKNLIKLKNPYID